MRPARAQAWVARALLLAAAGCAGPVVEGHVHEIRHGAARRLVVVPFAVPAGGPLVAGTSAGTVTDEADAAAKITRVVTEAFLAEGFEAVPASDLTRSYAVQGRPVPYGDIPALARRAAEGFGASSVLLGRLHRYREREGGEYGAVHPAAVGFELSIHAAPDGEKLWSARFDHTQQAFSAAPFQAWQYPGGGMRWLTAQELARWGAEQAAEQVARLP